MVYTSKNNTVLTSAFIICLRQKQKQPSVSDAVLDFDAGSERNRNKRVRLFEPHHVGTPSGVRTIRGEGRNRWKKGGLTALPELAYPGNYPNDCIASVNLLVITTTFLLYIIVFRTFRNPLSHLLPQIPELTVREKCPITICMDHTTV